MPITFPAVPAMSYSHAPKPTTNPYTTAIQAIREHVKGKYVLIFMGYSNLGYEHPEKVEEVIRKEIIEAIEKHGRENIVISAGVTPDGIGMVYKIAHSLGIHTIGIISSAAQEPENAPYCQPDEYCKSSIYIPRNPQKDPWSIEGSEEAGQFAGKSFTIAPIELTGPDPVSGRPNGHVVLVGGGMIAKEEIQQIVENNRCYHAYTDPNQFGPNKLKAFDKHLGTPEQQSPAHYYLMSLEKDAKVEK